MIKKILALQDLGAPDGVCFGCGSKNLQGLQIKSYWDFDNVHVIMEHKPDTRYVGWPSLVYGGLISCLVERILFILSALYLMYRRISELVSNDRWAPMMKHFYQKTDGSWWFKVVGKGNKLREIAVSDDMLAALKRYRDKLHLNPIPLPTEKTYLLPKEKGKSPMTDSRHIRRLIQYCFDRTINKLRDEKLFSEADGMESATVHW